MEIAGDNAVSGKTKNHVRTLSGCLTCRRRRIKCDEWKPICRRCIGKGRYCAGIYYQDAPSIHTKQTPPPEHNMNLHDDRRHHHQNPPPQPTTRSMLPQTWAIVEACEWKRHVDEYYYPRLLMHESIAIPLMQPLIDHPSNSITIATILQVRLVSAEKQDPSAYFPVKRYGTEQIWIKLYYWVQKSVQNINEDISRLHGKDIYEKACNYRLFQRIFYLMNIDMMLGSTNWKIHIDGFFTLFYRCARPIEVIKSNPALWSLLQHITMFAILQNTVSPPKKYITSVYNIKLEHLVDVFGYMDLLNAPFSSITYREVVRVTMLRAEVSKGASFKDRIFPEACAILQRMDTFDPDNWVERYPIPDIPEVYLTGKIFKLAGKLFTLKSLSISSPSLYPLPIGGGPGDKKLNWEDRELLCSELLKLLAESRKYIKCDVTLYWPMIVAGTFLVDGTKEDQQRLLGLVSTIDAGPASTNSHALIAKTLQDFWASGEVEWDDCWHDDRFFF